MQSRDSSFKIARAGQWIVLISHRVIFRSSPTQAPAACAGILTAIECRLHVDSVEDNRVPGDSETGTMPGV